MKSDITGGAVITQEGTLIQDFISFIHGRNGAPEHSRTAQTYLTNLRQFIAWMNREGIRQPAPADVIRYRDFLTATYKPNTAKQYLQSVKQFFAWTSAEGIYPDIAKGIRAPKVKQTHRKDSLTAREVLAIEQSITTTAAARSTAAAEAVKDTAGRIQRSTEQGKRLFAIYLLAVNAGLRTIEISRANIRDLELKNGQAVLYVWGKGCSEPDAKKPLAPAVYEAIRDYLDSRTDKPTGSSPLFVSTGNRSGGKRIASTTISKMIKQALREAGFDSERLTAHSLRHTAGQAVMDVTGQNIYQTQLYMRHSSPKTTEIYLENNATEQDAIIARRLYEHFHGGALDDGAEQLQAAIKTLNAEQLAYLAKLAAAMNTKPATA